MSDKGDLPQASDAPVGQRGMRFLELAVYIMGGLLVLMFFGLIAGTIWKISQHAPSKPPMMQKLDLGLSASDSVKSVQADGDHLIITTAGEIIVVDIRQNAVLSRISLGSK
jgi:hypothetical protein